MRGGEVRAARTRRCGRRRHAMATTTPARWCRPGGDGRPTPRRRAGDDFRSKTGSPPVPSRRVDATARGPETACGPGPVARGPGPVRRYSLMAEWRCGPCGTHLAFGITERGYVITQMHESVAAPRESGKTTCVALVWLPPRSRARLS
ncbi:protein of unknown function [Streptantibioticus cattleyicolor NRRL 8057 = DSM 46488]|nr:protein of unknown function [Streptantibioticus cattleyicolor NRRL 8057 = DSM 46488]